MTKFVSLLETGKRVLFGRQIETSRKSEKVLAADALAFLKPEMLCFVDRHYLGHKFLKLALATREADANGQESTGVLNFIRYRIKFNCNPMLRMVRVCQRGSRHRLI